MIINAESLAAVHTHTHTHTHTILSNEQTLEAFFVPQIKIETSKVTHTK